MVLCCTFGTLMNINKHARAWGMLGSLSLVLGGFGGCLQTFLTLFLPFPFLSFSWWFSIHWNDWRFVHQPFLFVRVTFPTHWHPVLMAFTFCVSCSPCYIFPLSEWCPCICMRWHRVTFFTLLWWGRPMYAMFTFCNIGNQEEHNTQRFQNSSYILLIWMLLQFQCLFRHAFTAYITVRWKRP